MDLKINELDVVLTLQNGTKILNKDDVAKTLNLSPAQKETCLFVFQDPADKCIFFLFNLGEVETREDFEEVLRVFTETNEASGAKLVNYNKITATDGRVLDIQKYLATNYTTLAIFAQLNGHLLYGLSQCIEENSKAALDFSVNIMKTLSPAK